MSALKSIFNLVKTDHANVKQAYENYISAEDNLDEQNRWANEFRWELARIIVAEELVVYPAIEKHLGDEGKRIAHEDRAEHHKIKELLKKLETTSVSDPDYRVTFDTAKDFLMYHIAGVYAACLINNAGDVGYSGPTYIAIRSAKHDKSISANHRDDFNRLVKLQEFNSAALDSSNNVKPIVIITVDGGPDENPRFPKTLASSIDIFKTHNLDALFVLTHAPGQSAFNAVERRMAPLSHDLSGLILPHDHFGTHLDANGNTIDLELEKQNFKKAGEVLAEAWSNTVIDSHPVVASYVNSSFTSQVSSKIDESWCDRHVLQSQYTLQIVRCNSQDCCGEWRSNYLQVFSQRFLPPPVPFVQGSSGLVIAESDSEQDRFCGSLFQRLQLSKLIHKELNSSSVPFDYFCTSVKQSIPKRICNICNKYFPTMERRKNHCKIHKSKITIIDTEISSSDENEHHEPTLQSINKSADDQLKNIYIIHDLAEWLKPTFEEI
ncbi:unnamed protein product [Rotaria sp. Silwood2]|nr:unnamed protein product [Rotaria sp. Silwood2]